MEQEKKIDLFEHSPIAQALISEKGKILRSNIQFNRLSAFQNFDNNTSTVFDAFTTISKALLQQKMMTANTDPSFCQLHFRKHPDELHVALSKYTDKQFLFAIQNTFARKEPARLIEKHRQRLLQSIEAISVSILLIDLHGRHSIVNHHFLNLLGKTKLEIEGKSIQDLSSESSAKNFMNEMAAVHLGKQQSFTLEHEFIHEDGSSVWTQLGFVALQENSTRTKNGIVNLTDITQSKKNEHLLRLNRKWIEEISEIVPAGMAILDTSGKVLRLNRFFTQMVGYQISDIPTLKRWMGKAYPRAKHKELLLRWRTEFSALLDSKTLSKKYIDEIRCIDGTKKHITLRFKMVNGRILAIFTDVSGIKENERKLKELNTTKDKLFSIIAHDLKNPFNTLIGYSELLDYMWEKFTSDEVRAHVKRMENAAKKGYNLLENLLLWARKQTEQIGFQPEELFVKDFLEPIQSLFEDQALNKKIHLVFDYSEKMKVYADRDMLNTILRNLISNAIKFTYEGGTVELSLKSWEAEAKIEVRDNGIGIPVEVQEQIFELVEKPVRQGTAGETGTGIGLNLCREFVEEHGGYLQLNSQEGIGSSFSFSLPHKKLVRNVKNK